MSVVAVRGEWIINQAMARHQTVIQRTIGAKSLKVENIQFCFLQQLMIFQKNICLKTCYLRCTTAAVLATSRDRQAINVSYQQQLSTSQYVQ